MTIRNYQPSDYPAIADIYNASKLDELTFEKRQHTLLPLESDEPRQADLLSSTIFVYGKDAIQGYSAVKANTIQSLYVHPRYRRQGVARALLNVALQQINGAAMLQVVKSNSPSKALYYEYGFVDVEEYEVNYNGVNVTVNRMLRQQ
ncbi:MAG: ribosomal protein S18 acetylase RimI-like enzyme [Oceanicoccus sp.]|jgi:ribosomal protein S18 acetylase RimI-like enzyme